jgi:hypothetical protein
MPRPWRVERNGRSAGAACAGMADVDFFLLLRLVINNQIQNANANYPHSDTDRGAFFTQVIDF